jgi:hypothetical protein
VACQLAGATGGTATMLMPSPPKVWTPVQPPIKNRPVSGRIRNICYLYVFEPYPKDFLSVRQQTFIGKQYVPAAIE